MILSKYAVVSGFFAALCVSLATQIPSCLGSESTDADAAAQAYKNALNNYATALAAKPKMSQQEKDQLKEKIITPASNQYEDAEAKLGSASIEQVREKVEDEFSKTIQKVVSDAKLQLIKANQPIPDALASYTPGKRPASPSPSSSEIPSASPSPSDRPMEEVTVDGKNVKPEISFPGNAPNPKYAKFSKASPSPRPSPSPSPSPLR